MAKKGQKATLAELRAIDKYNKANMVQFSLRLHKEREADVIECLRAQESKREFLIKLIRQSMKGEGR